MSAAEVATGLDRVRDRIARAGGDPERTTVVAVTKGFPAEAARWALDAGLADLGENYAQEAAAKIEQLGRSGGRWHFIGQLQRNKVRVRAPAIDVWQTIDRLRVAEAVADRAPGATVLVQVNLTDDADRGGCRLALAPGVVAGCRDLGLDVRGLMAVGPPGPSEMAERGFRAVVDLADRLDLPVRSLGMSADLEVAVRAGSTMLRLGTALFGGRPPLARAVVED
jgi:pyridoxal phosphate enzyme (YggS family)